MAHLRELPYLSSPTHAAARAVQPHNHRPYPHTPSDLSPGA